MSLPSQSQLTPKSSVTLLAPMQATVVFVASEGTPVQAHGEIVVVEAMKMEHVVHAPTNGVVSRLLVRVGEIVEEGQALAEFSASDFAPTTSTLRESTATANSRIRADLQEVLDRHSLGFDEHRVDAVAKRRRTNQRTARENVNDLVDPGSFIEYAPLVVAAQRKRRAIEDLVTNTPGDGMVAGIGTVNADQFPGRESRVCVMTYDYTVLAGTQGHQNHRKKDRLFELTERLRIPLILFAEGGGGRPGDTDGLGVAGLDGRAFALFGKLSGHVPLVGIVSGYCFAGNAALLGCCDVIIATEGSHIGMGGPAMIEGGGLGVFAPTDIGPLSVQIPNGVVDIVVPDEASAVEIAKKYLAFFQGPIAEWSCADQMTLRNLIPENRLRAYDIRSVIYAIADTASVLELRRGFAAGMVTVLARVEGRPVAIVANDPTHLGGAIDADACDKAARFLQLADAHNIPVVFLCDTPGFMVGPDSERMAAVRKTARMFVTGASLTVPFCTIVLRKGYGLGAMAMAGGSFREPLFTIGWPTSEFGGMGLEGAVRLGYRKELEAIADPNERADAERVMIERMYEHGKGVSMATHFEIDDVIDPADTRRWIRTMLDTARTENTTERGRDQSRRPMIDSW